MKKEIHPDYHKNAKIVCACGNSMDIGSTKKEIFIELCSACHPFYTGKQKLVDTARRVEKFKAKVEAQKEASKNRKGRKAKTITRTKLKEAKKKATEK
jgi:large subunit ribosomal protein L31